MRLSPDARPRGHLVVLVVSFLSLLVTCSSDEPPLKELSQGCLINTDCNSPLVCAFRSCHVECKVSRDCDPGQRCVVSDRPYHVCQLDAEKRCTYNSSCPEGQACGIDGQCRDMCKADRDCLSEQRCVSGTCAEEVELTADGGLPASTEAGPPDGQPCSYDSDCTAPLVCRTGLCGYQCITVRDCPAGQSCNAHRCTQASTLCPGMEAGTGDGTCTTDSPCPPPTICQGGRCICECVFDQDCQEGYACNGNRCQLSGSYGSEGATFQSADQKIEVTIPPGALTHRVLLTARLADTIAPGALGPVYELEPSGTLFKTPVTVTYHFDPASLGGLPAADLRLATLSGSGWVTLASAKYDPVAHTVSGTTSHFSTFGVIPSASAGTCAQTTMELAGVSPSCTWTLPGLFDPNAGQIITYLKGTKQVLQKVQDGYGCSDDGGAPVNGWFYQGQGVVLCFAACGGMSEGMASSVFWYSSGCP
jgi:hypothetical protein